MVLKRLKRKLFGKKLAPAELRDYLASEKFQPVFFLSTGRCGTRWFTELLHKDKHLHVHHSTAPELYEQSLLAYQLHKAGKTADSTIERLLEETVYCARQELMNDAILNGKRFVETNNRIGFFAPQLAQMFPHAKFVHLYRDPAGFIKSGMNRGWYDDSRFDFARPFPVSGPEKEDWHNWSRVAKIAWLWRETNQMIDGFVSEWPAERYRRFNFSELNTDSVFDLMQWLQVDIEPNVISAQLNQKINAQKSGDFPSYPDWTDQDRSDFLKICGDYAQFLGFDYKS